MSLRTLPLLMTMCLVALGASVRADAQSTSCDGGSTCNFALNARATTNYVVRLVLSSSSTTLNAPTAGAFDNATGVNTPNAVTLEVRSNGMYTITAAAAASTFTGGSGLKSSSSIQYTTDGFATMKNVSGSGSQLATSAGATGTLTYTIGYRTMYSWTVDTPGTYTLPINYTLTAP